VLCALPLTNSVATLSKVGENHDAVNESATTSLWRSDVIAPSYKDVQQNVSLAIPAPAK
jgi:hypothetical protein